MDKYHEFTKNVFKLIKLDLTSYKEKQMKRRINSLVTRNGFKDFDDYFIALKKDKELFNQFINYLTINVSEFYRNEKQWDILEENIIPDLIKNNKSLKIWSSACSTGEEPYSLVMLMTKFYRLNNIKVYATDIDEGAIAKAKLGIYNEKSIKSLPKEFKVKYFDKIGNSFKIKDDIKNRVQFSKLNLLEDNYPSNCHLIICRNVMIYFTQEAKDKIYHKFKNSLTDDGVFFVGSTEQIIKPLDYNLKPIRTFFYSKA
ncbi:CheR family methyltransferase [Abyssisolibacter fermentans]|uniref:CheR family methyltransferase n=1 Tax=Abyssisolibacter fermentans TaxID=1766203 RepID=UPI00082E6B2F|nr:protein-glutamate O-methyltransferase CheR [Abyssisolibacter fermentans]